MEVSMEIRPIPPKTIRLAGRGLQREVEKMNAAVALAERSGFGARMEALLSRLARL
jgi:hypothetical protein